MKPILSLAFSTFVVAVFCIAIGGFALGLAGWRDGTVVGRIGVLLLLLFSGFAILSNWNEMKGGQNLAPVKPTGRKRSFNFPAREFRHENRTLLTGLLVLFAVLPAISALALGAAHLTKRGNIPAEFVLAMSAVAVLIGSVCAWCAVRVWNASIVLAPEGVTVRMTYARGKFAWEELVGFERVQIPDGNGEMRWWFRLVTVKRAYLFQDTLENREWFIRTVKQASGLELVDAA